MLSLALAILSATVAAGAVLALLHLRGSRPHWAVGVLHGLLGTAGLGALLLALRGPPRGVRTGVAAFGLVAAIFATAAFAVGLAILALLRRSRGGTGLAIAIHGMLAITAFVLLLAYVSLG